MGEEEDEELVKEMILKTAGRTGSGAEGGGVPAVRAAAPAKKYDLMCAVCNTGVVGAKGAQEHAKATGHQNFEEYAGGGGNTTGGGGGEAAAGGGGGASGGGGGAGGGGGDTEMAEVEVEPEVDAGLLQQLIDEMGFPRVRALKGLYYGGGNVEGAVTWLMEHAEDADIDEPLKVSPTGPKLSYEERKAKLDALLERKRKENAVKQKELERAQELERIRSNKELMEAKRKQEEQERKRLIEETQREKERQAKERERLRAELEKDKMERASRAGKSVAAAAPKEAAVDPNAKRMAKTRLAIRKLYSSCRVPEDAARKALELAAKIIGNAASNPSEEKFRAVRVANPALQSVLLGKDGGVALLLSAGFEEDGERLVLKGELDVAWMETVTKEIAAAVAKGPFY